MAGVTSIDGSNRLVHDDDERREDRGALREVPDPLHQVLERPLQPSRRLQPSGAPRDHQIVLAREPSA